MTEEDLVEGGTLIDYSLTCLWHKKHGWNLKFTACETPHIMNGTSYSNFDNQEHILKLGETFEKHPKSAYHTVRCKWNFESDGDVWLLASS